MKKTTFLSIDLDFWGPTRSGACTKFINKILSLGALVKCYIEHDHMLRRINAPENQELKILANVDFHDDLMEVDDCNIAIRRGLTCANWVEYVSWRQSGKYLWCSPDKKAALSMGDGICGEFFGDLTKSYGKTSSWKKISVVDGIRGFSYDAVAEVGICLSPHYADPRSTASAVRVLLENVPMNHFVKRAYRTWLESQPISKERTPFWYKNLEGK